MIHKDLLPYLFMPIFFVLGFLFNSAITRISEDDYRMTRIRIAEYGIEKYFAKHNLLPSSLADLSDVDAARYSDFSDRRGKQLQYSSTSNLVRLFFIDKAIEAHGFKYRISRSFLVPKTLPL